MRVNLSYLLVCLLLLTGSAFASELGRSLPLNQKQGEPQFRVFYSYGSEAAWVFHFQSTQPSFEASHQSFHQSEGKWFWSVYDSGERRLLFNWQNFSVSDLQSGTLRLLDKRALQAILPRQRDMVVVFAQPVASDFHIMYFISLQPLCDGFGSSRFHDLTSKRFSCSVREDQIPNWAHQCDQFAGELNRYLSQGRINCSQARQAHLDQGCGEFHCSSEELR